MVWTFTCAALHSPSVPTGSTHPRNHWENFYRTKGPSRTTDPSSSHQFGPPLDPPLDGGGTMPSDFLSPFLDLDEEFCKTFHPLVVPDIPSTSSRVLGFQRRHSLSHVTLPNSKFTSDGSDCPWGLDLAPPQQWTGRGQLPRSCLSHIPFRVDRSVSMIEGGVGALGGGDDQVPRPSPSLLLPPPGFCLSSTTLSSSTRPLAPLPHLSTRYKTELCRTYDESGTCKYGAKCQFAHGLDELRGLSRHPKYKTEPCRTFHTIGFCPYGARCHFIHNAEELLPPGGATPPQQQKLRPPLLRHSISFAGFSTPLQTFQPVEEVQPQPVLLTRASSVSPSTSSGTPDLLSPLLPEPGPLKHCSYLFSGAADLAGHSPDSALRFYAVSDSATSGHPASAFNPKGLTGHMTHQLPVSLSPLTGLHRCSSADSLSEEGYTSSCSLSSCSSGAESPSFEGRRLPIFSRLSITDE